MRNPFHITGPAIISFSGGRTSAYMLHEILAAHGGTLPEDVKVVFTNTGREMPETLDFIQQCADAWNVEVIWLEYRAAEKPADRWARVSYDTASRDGEPLIQIFQTRNMLPNPIARICTVEGKILTVERWVKAALGWRDYTKVLGLRADERHRVARLGNQARKGVDPIAPLATARVTKADVTAFWGDAPFDLALPNIGGKTPLGNCDLCFLKSAATISGIMRDRPELARWWIKVEAEARSSKPYGARFRKDRPSYAEMLDAVQRQHPFDFGEADALSECNCTD